MITPIPQTQSSTVSGIQAFLKSTGYTPPPKPGTTPAPRWQDLVTNPAPAVTPAPPPAPPPAPTNTLGAMDAKETLAGAQEAATAITTAGQRFAATPTIKPGSGTPVIQAVKTEAAKTGDLLEGALGAAAGGIRSVFAPLTATIQKLSETASDNPTVQAFARSPVVSAMLDATNNAESPLNKWAAANPRAATDLQNAMTVALTAAGGGEADPLLNADLGETATGLKNAATDVIGTPPGPDGSGGSGVRGAIADVKDSFAAKPLSPEEQASQATAARQTADQTIVDKYTQAIKPTIVGQKTAGARDAYNSNVVTAVRAIDQNKEALSFKDEAGNTETGRTPNTPAELSDAVAQTKRNIFSQYDAQAKAAGDAGAKVDSKPVVDELNQVIDSKALALTNPEAVQYARGVRGRLSDGEDAEGNPKYNQYDTKTAQDIVTNYNASLDAFYRNPSYVTASRAAIDARVAAQFRQGLDEAINSATGENYAALKKAYGALSSIEKDVTKRGIVLARQTPGGLGKYVDMFGENNMLDGLLTLSPTRIAEGALKIGINHLYQYFNSPDRAIQGMFDAAAKTR